MSGAIVWATAVYRSGEPGVITVTPWVTGIPETVDYPTYRYFVEKGLALGRY